MGAAALVVVLCSALTACSGPGSKSATDDTGAGSNVPPAPETPGSQPGPSQSGGLSQHEDTLRQFAETFGVEDPPDVEPIRYVSSGEERADVMKECLTEAGFPVTVGDDGAVVMEFASPEQTSDYNRASYVCMAQYPLDPRMTGELADAQLDRYYDWLLAHPVACMRERGHPVAEPPTRETFIANYRATGELLFFADDLPPDLEAEIMGDVLEHCETEPPVEVLFPESP